MLIALILYAVGLSLLGTFLSRQVKTSADFFVAGRRLGPGLLFTTLLAANIGAGTTVGVAGRAYQSGLSAWWWVGSAGIGSFVLATTVGPKIWRLARDNSFFTVGDYLEWRHDRRVRTTVAALLWLGSLFILASQLAAISLIFEVVAGTPKAWGCLIGGIVVIVYFSAGGLKGSAWVNLVQLAVMGAGFILALPMALESAGGWQALGPPAISAQPAGAYFSLLGGGLPGTLGYILLLVPAFIVSPGLLQKIYGARDEAAVRRGVAWNAGVLVVYSFLPVLLGMIAAAALPDLSHPDRALMRVMTDLLPSWLGGLLLAAVFSAEVSSSDAILFMLSTSLTQDFYKTHIDPHIDERRLLRLSRWIAAISGVLGVGIAFWLPSILTGLTFFYALLSVALTAPLLIGLYTAKPLARASFWIILASVAGTVVLSRLTSGPIFGVLSAEGVGILASLATLGLVAWRRRPR